MRSLQSFHDAVRDWLNDGMPCDLCLKAVRGSVDSRHEKDSLAYRTFHLVMAEFGSAIPIDSEDRRKTFQQFWKTLPRKLAAIKSIAPTRVNIEDAIGNVETCITDVIMVEISESTEMLKLIPVGRSFYGALEVSLLHILFGKKGRPL